jgi:FkbM family methyltransferase
MKISKRINLAISLLEDRRFLSAMFTWPKFSLTSFLMISRLQRQGICPKTILDVGANVGQFAVAGAKIFSDAQVYSFEPDPNVAEKLQKNVSSLKNVKVFQVALGDQSGEVDFHVNAYNLSSSILPLAQAHKEAFPGAVEKNTITVKLSTLDEIADTLSLTPPVLLKLDVQGYEAKTLAGALRTLKKVDYLIVETSLRQLYKGEILFRDILGMLEEQGFSFLRPVDTCFDERNGEILQMDALFVKHTK